MSDPKVDPQAQRRHDLRTPLHQIIGYAEPLEDEVRDAGQEKYVADLQEVRAARVDRDQLLGVSGARTSGSWSWRETKRRASSRGRHGRS